MATASKPSVVTIEQLSIQNPSYSPDLDDPTDKIPEEDILPSRPFDRNARPQSSRSIRSTTSRTSVNNLDGRIHCHDYHAQRFFSYREHGFEKAVINIYKNFFPQSQIDDESRLRILKRAWLLIDIDHWDMHREVIIMLMDTHILILRYNFIKEKILYSQSIPFDDIRSVLFGPLCYPDRSLMGEYAYGGIKIVHGDEPSFLTRWNPSAQTNIHLLVSHHLAYNEKERETVFYNCDDFIQSLETALTVYRQTKNESPIEFVEDKILIYSYASLVSVLFNQNNLGFNRDRNGAVF